MTILTQLLSLIYEHQYNASQFINNAQKVSDTPIAMWSFHTIVTIVAILTHLIAVVY